MGNILDKSFTEKRKVYFVFKSLFFENFEFKSFFFSKILYSNAFFSKI